VITIVDLDIGNLQSVANAFNRVGVEVTIAQTASAAADASIMVLPGVGAFERAMHRLNERGLGPVIRHHALERRRPLIGICLGMQLLADRSFEHGCFDGLGIIAGDVVQLQPSPPEYRVPNIGWREVRAAKATAMLPAGVDGQSFYHVHSFHLACKDPADVAGTFEFGGGRVVTAVERGNVFGVQFHPEKSQDAGLDLLHSLLRHIRAAAHT
jgi:imidazole glycerol-phosphate synthase subunit HisH